MHRFGGTWTQAKLEALGKYLSAYTQALKHQQFSLHYVDAFAGTGVYRAKSDPATEMKGSASIALATNGFQRYTFIDKRKSHVRSLRVLADSHPDQDIQILHGDANQHIAAFCEREDWRGQRAVMFLDPYGLTVEWKTLECIRRTGAIDVWYLFPLNGLLRQMTNDPADRDDDKDRSLDRLLGTNAWRIELYAPEPTGDLFGADPLLRRTQERGVVLEWLTARLGTVFPYVHKPAVLHMGNRRSRHGGPALFALYFVMSNDQPKAVGLAKRLVPGVFEDLRKSGTLA